MSTKLTQSRRGFFAATGAVLGSQLLPSSASAAPQQEVESFERNAIVYAFKIGEIEAWSISDGQFNMKQGLDLMYPESERDAMAKVLEEHAEPLDILPLYVNILVIRKGDDVIVFDAGFGLPEASWKGWLADGLEQIGIHPDEVTAGLLSHSHIDHLAGFVLDGKPFFKNAKVHLTPEEYAFWTADEPDFTYSRRDPARIPGMVKKIKEQLKALESVLVQTPAGTQLFDGMVTIEDGFGHTPGHAYFRIKDGSEELVHIADLAHHHLLMFDDPNWCIGFDHNPTPAIASRKRVFKELAENRSRAYGFHLAFPGLGNIMTTEKGGYRWNPERFVW